MAAAMDKKTAIVQKLVAKVHSWGGRFLQ
jgi:hypothetical protein